MFIRSAIKGIFLRTPFCVRLIIMVVWQFGVIVSLLQVGHLHLFAARHTAQCHILRSTRSMGMKELRHQKGCVCLGGAQVGAIDDVQCSCPHVRRCTLSSSMGHSQADAWPLGWCREWHSRQLQTGLQQACPRLSANLVATRHTADPNLPCPMHVLLRSVRRTRWAHQHCVAFYY